MIEAFRVGTTITLTDLITPKLLELSKSLLKVELQVAGLDRQFKQIGKSNGGIKQASNYTAALDKAVMKTDQHAQLLVKTFGKLSKFDGKAAAGAGALMAELDKSDGAAGRLTGHLAKIVAFNPEMRLLATSTKALSDALRSSSSNAALLQRSPRHALAVLRLSKRPPWFADFAITSSTPHQFPPRTLLPCSRGLLSKIMVTVMACIDTRARSSSMARRASSGKRVRSTTLRRQSLRLMDIVDLPQ
jgi:hypothetical protein